MTTNTEQELLKHVIDVKQTLGELVGTVRSLELGNETRDSRLNDHAKRIRVLEGYAVFVGACILTVGYILTKIIPVAAQAASIIRGK